MKRIRINANKTGRARRFATKTRAAVLAGLFAALSFFIAPPAKAFCFPGCCFSTVIPAHVESRRIISEEHDHLRLEVFGFSIGVPPFPVRPVAGTDNRLQQHELWLLETFFDDHLLPALMMMTEQLVSVMMKQMFVIGAFMDAENQLSSQRIFQELAARAHKDYHPSFSMCEIGTGTRSLAAADFSGDLTKMTLNKRFLDRQLGQKSSVGGAGPQEDRASVWSADKPTPYNRLGFFFHNTCDNKDLNRVLANMQTGLFLCAGAPPANGRSHRDIDWNNTVMSPRTINVEFDRPASDNRHVFEMANYLYGHRIFSRPEGNLLYFEAPQDNFLDSRAVTAKRSVGQNSFNAIIGLKSRGTHPDDPGVREISSRDTAEFMRFFMVELGFPLNDPMQYHRYMYHKTGSAENPPLDEPGVQISYYGQMEMLAKKIYQRPEFYTQLYDKPANVKRKSAAMQAIKLMLERDIFDSQLRAEAIMSMILELKVIEEQQSIENKLGLMQERFR